MSAGERPDSFDAALLDLMAWVRATSTRAALIGGLAASARGRARMTRDIDLLLLAENQDWAALLNTAAQFNFDPRHPQALEFAQQSRMLLLRHGPSQIDVDVMLGLLPFERDLVDRATPVRLGKTAVPIPPPEDLIVMKALARRPRDLEDIRGMLAANPGIDRGALRQRVAELAAELGESEILSDFDALLGASQ